VLFKHILTVVRGGGDLASGVIYRLHRSGFPVIVTELAAPLLVRRAVSFGEAIYTGEVTIEGVVAKRAGSIQTALNLLESGVVPLLVDEDGQAMHELEPTVIVDARMAKVNIDTTITDAPLIVALGPGFEAGVDCHAVIETNRGHHLGRVIWSGSAEPDTGTPGAVNGLTHTRVLRSPAAGHIQAQVKIGDTVRKGETIAVVDTQPIFAPFDGVLRGIIHADVVVAPGMKIGDLDPRTQPENCFTISDKSLAIGGGVLEAILSAPQLNKLLIQAGDETTSSI